MSVKNSVKIIFAPKSKKSLSICRIVTSQKPYSPKALSAAKDNDNNANADKNIHDTGRAARKYRIKFVVCVTHQLWLPANSKIIVIFFTCQ